MKCEEKQNNRESRVKEEEEEVGDMEREGGCSLTGIWKRCNLAASGSGERTNVCLMWDCPGHVIGLFTRERLRGGYEKKKNVVKCSKLCVGAECVLLMSPLFPLLFFHLIASLSTSCLSLLRTDTEQHESLNVCALLCLVSVRKARVTG